MTNVLLPLVSHCDYIGKDAAVLLIVIPQLTWGILSFTGF